MHHNRKLVQQHVFSLIELFQRWFEGCKENGCIKLCFSFSKIAILQTWGGIR